jgi:cytidylate kinase
MNGVSPATLGRNPPVIAIDGPAASGKGTIAQGVARALDYAYLDSGSLYRLVALTALRQGVAVDDERELARIAGGLEPVFAGDRIEIDGGDVAQAIRTPAVTSAASRIAVLAGVRQALLTRQRKFRREPGLVADGRDMGTVVFPDAALKVYVTASAEERARRRHKQLIEKGNSVIIDSLLHDIRERDARDKGRAVAPLRPADDAIVLDTTGMSIEESITFVLEQYRLQRGKDAG